MVTLVGMSLSRKIWDAATGRAGEGRVVGGSNCECWRVFVVSGKLYV